MKKKNETNNNNKLRVRFVDAIKITTDLKPLIIQ